MTAQQAVLIGGVFNLLFAAFHLFFWKIFRWREALAPLDAINRGVVQILNLCLTFAFLAGAGLYGYAYLAVEHSVGLLPGF